MQNAGNYNLTVDYPGTWSQKAATAAGVPDVVQHYWLQVFRSADAA
jgi:hypothetical protein